MIRVSGDLPKSCPKAFLGVDFCDCVKQLTCGNRFREENGCHEVTADRLFSTGSLGRSRRYRVARADGDSCLSQLAPFAVVDCHRERTGRATIIPEA